MGYGPMFDPAITASYCTDIYDRWSQGGGPLQQMSSNMDAGMVLAMSAWYAREVYPLQNGLQQTGMSWLDGQNFWGGHTTKAGPCDTMRYLVIFGLEILEQPPIEYLLF